MVLYQKAYRSHKFIFFPFSAFMANGNTSTTNTSFFYENVTLFSVAQKYWGYIMSSFWARFTVTASRSVVSPWFTQVGKNTFFIIYKRCSICIGDKEYTECSLLRHLEVCFIRFLKPVFCLSFIGLYFKLFFAWIPYSKVLPIIHAYIKTAWRKLSPFCDDRIALSWVVWLQ